MANIQDFIDKMYDLYNICIVVNRDCVGLYDEDTVDFIENFRAIRQIFFEYLFDNGDDEWIWESDYIITEGTALANPYWEYSRNKIACEEFLLEKYRQESFPITIVRPSHTYCEKSIPLGVHGKNGSWQVIKRIKEGKPVIIQGDGTSLWTLTFNKDFAIGFMGLMGNIHAIGEAFQITGDETLSWNQIYQIIADALGVQLKAYHVASEFLAAVGEEYDLTGSLIGDKSNSVVFDNSKIKRTLIAIAQSLIILLNSLADSIQSRLI